MKAVITLIKPSLFFIFLVIVSFYSQSIIGQTSFQDNLSGETNGNWPSKWKLIRGSAEVASLNGEPIIYLSNNAIITPALNNNNYLTNNFSLEFDAYFDDVRRNPVDQSYNIRFWKGSGSSSNTQGGKNNFMPLTVYLHGGRITGYINGKHVVYEGYRQDMRVEKQGLWRKVTVNYNNGAFKVFVDGFLAVNIPYITFKPTMISIAAYASTYTDFIRGIKNIRISPINNNTVGDNTITDNNPPDNNGSGTDTTNTTTQNNYNYTLPIEDGAASQILQTDGNGNVTWVDDVHPENNNTIDNNTVGQTGAVAYTMPTVDGTTNQVLQTDGNGNVSWVDNIHSENNNTVIDTTNTNTTAGSEGIKINDLLDGKSDNDGKSIYIGLNAGAADNSTDNRNTGLGFETLKNNNTGYANTAYGHQALSSNTIGNSNTATGIYALYSNNSGKRNIATGSSALAKNTTGNNNTANGVAALRMNTTGNDNIAIGASAGYSNIVGNNNVFIGSQSGFNELSSNKLYIENTNADANNALIYGEFDNNILRTNSQFQIGNPTNGGYAFPKIDGTANQVLQTDGNGNISWVGGTSSGSNTSTGLEAINEGNGIGWRLKGQNPNNYGNIGRGAVDLSTSLISSDSNGATGLGSFSIGFVATASGIGSIAIGSNSKASGDYSTAIGNIPEASGTASTALGSNTKASGDYSTAIGNFTRAIGVYSTAMGSYTVANYPNNFVIGKYNDNSVYSLFEVGNGSSGARSNAFTILKSGKVGIGTSNPNVKLQITGGSDASYSNGTGYIVLGKESSSNIVIDANEIMARKNGASSALYIQNSGGDLYVGGSIVHSSDARLKQDIKNINYGLDEILKLRPVSYLWKANPNVSLKSLGLIAQEVQPILKELVTLNTKRDNTLGVNYTELIPVLIKAIQEQQELINSLQSTVNSQQSTIQKQDSKINTLNTEMAQIQSLEQRINNMEQILKSTQQ